MNDLSQVTHLVGVRLLTLTTTNYLFPKWNPCDTCTHGVNNDNYNNNPVAVCMVILFIKYYIHYVIYIKLHEVSTLIIPILLTNTPELREIAEMPMVWVG